MRVMRFEEKLAKLCAQRGWNQSRLAALVSRAAGKPVSKNTVSRWFSGAVRPFDDWFLPLARTLSVDCDYLADDAADDVAAPELSEDERFILQLLRDSGLGRADVVRALTGYATHRPPLAPSTGPSVFPSTDPETGQPIDDRKRRQARS